MSAGHTPGPWQVAVEIFDNDGQPETAIQALNSAATVAVALEFGPNNPHMREANARLIAAAPDLLEALAYALKDMEQVQEVACNRLSISIGLARAAIAKATGGAA